MINGTRYKGVAETTQAIGERLKNIVGKDITQSSIARVVEAYPNTMTCDIESSNGMLITNVPLLTKCGLEKDEVFGEIELPSKDTYVVVANVGGKESFPFIIGTFYPYSTNKYQSGQKAVKSNNKQFTLKLLEDIAKTVFRKIFRSGTSVEVMEDGTFVLETPSGTYITINETNENIIIEDKHGNITTMDSAGMRLEDKNGNTIEMGSSSVKINNNLEVLQ